MLEILLLEAVENEHASCADRTRADISAPLAESIRASAGGQRHGAHGS